MKTSFALCCMAVAAAGVSGFVVPPSGAVRAPALLGGKYDGQVWDDAAKKDVLSTYDASKPWSEINFDPFKKDAKGNSCDTRGFYPGEGKYKDPIRPAVSWAEYQAKLQADGK
ncbi:unnamed protein product [Choristocarpus tenellus]